VRVLSISGTNLAPLAALLAVLSRRQFPGEESLITTPGPSTSGAGSMDLRSNLGKGIFLSQVDLLQTEERVRCRLSGLVREFRLELRSDGLVLRGLARTYYAKQMAQHAALEASGLPLVANEIEVS
jgi:hypothetical protein